MSETYDNGGHRISHPFTVDPEAASGQTLTTSGSTDTDATLTVATDRTYAITNIHATAHVIFGILTTATAANVIWVCPPGETILIHIPDGTTALHHQSATASVVLYVRKLKLNT